MRMIIYALLIILLYVFYILYIKRTAITNITSIKLKNGEKDDINDIEAETGDLILFRWHTVDVLHELFSSFTHVGMIIEINSKKYILETHLKGDTIHMGYKSGGVHIYDLEERINMYEGDNYILKINRDLINKSNEKILYDNLQDYLLIPFQDEYRDHYTNVCIPNMFCDGCVKSTKKGMFCSEFIGFLLRELGILNEKVNTNCLTPSSFIDMKIIDTKNDRKIPIYDNIYKII